MIRLVFKVRDYGHCAAGCDDRPITRMTTVDVEIPSIEPLLLTGADHRGYEYAQLVGCEVVKETK